MNIDTAALEEIISNAPNNFVIKDALVKCYEEVQLHNRILCLISGGQDSDVMLDMMIRCGAKGKTDFLFCNTGLEYSATIEHLAELENKYGITIRRVNAEVPIPICVKKYGVPFWSKYVSDMMYRLQRHNFSWEDKPYEKLVQEYPKCQTALKWWCNYGETDKFSIRRSPFLKEFIINNPPRFKISDKCCTYAKKNVAHKIAKDYDMQCVGIRRAEGGIRAAAFHNCFTVGLETDQFRPIFWLSNTDKMEYIDFYSITNSRCYTEYGLVRTGCFGCPFGKAFEEELSAIEEFEPNLLKAANKIFGESYDYTRSYLQFRNEKKRGLS